MTLILRLQGLAGKAGIEDIRSFFGSLHIPHGGVYIVGGSLGEAFIAFSTQADIQLAMRYNRKSLKGSKVTLHMSSMVDTENPQTSVVDSLDSNTAFLLGICTVLQELHSSQQRENKETVPRVDLPNADSTIVTSDVRHDEVNPRLKPGYVRLFGLPASATKEDIINFFKGLAVEEAIVNVSLGHGYGCLVKFADAQDAHKALDFSQQSLGSCVEVRGATEKMWRGALQECGNMFHKPPKWSRLDCDPANSFSTTVEYTVMVRNLPQNMTKTEIKELFGCPNIAHKKIMDKIKLFSNLKYLFGPLTKCKKRKAYLPFCYIGHYTQFRQ
uniref:RRM domain-containing protein n=1 Tax=Echeneis naucrates TaxID=173247 RepID=A0A665WGA4_ECHNA